MNAIKTALVGISLSPDDEATLAWLHGLVMRLHIETVHLVHVLPSSPLSTPETEAALSRSAEQQLAALRAGLNLGQAHITAEVVQGNVSAQLLSLCLELSVDVLLLGRSSRRSLTLGSSVGALVRKAPCSVLVVPRGADFAPGPVLVPIDFSDASRRAVEWACALARPHHANTPLVLQHVYAVPLGYHALGRSYEELAPRMEKLAREHFHDFSQNLPLTGLDTTVRYDLQPETRLHSLNPAYTTLTTALELEPGLIVIGSRGRTPSAALLLGSVASRVVTDADRPVLVVKGKRDNMGLIEALRRL